MQSANPFKMLFRNFRSKACILLLSTCCRPAMADVISDFQQAYPKAAAKLEESYSHVKINSTETRTEQSNFLWKEAIEFEREGDAFRAKRTVIESNDPHWPAGMFGAFGSDDKIWFDVYRAPGEQDFKFNGFGANPNFKKATFLKCIPCYAAYSVMSQRIVDYFQSKSLQVVSVKSVNVGGSDLIKVDTEFVREKALGPSKGEFYFLPVSMAVTSWTINTPNNAPKNLIGSWRARIDYEANSNPPRIVRSDYWMENAQSLRYSGRKNEISKIEFGPVPLNDFNVAAIGVKNIPLEGSLDPSVLHPPENPLGGQPSTTQRTSVNDIPANDVDASTDLSANVNGVGGSLSVSEHRDIYIWSLIVLVGVGVTVQVLGRYHHKSKGKEQ